MDNVVLLSRWVFVGVAEFEHRTWLLNRHDDGSFDGMVQTFGHAFYGTYAGGRTGAVGTLDACKRMVEQHVLDLRWTRQ